MNRTLNWLRNAAFALAITASLGFGAAQALAGTAPAQETRACNDYDCDEYCKSLGAWGGSCNGGQCECLL